MSPIAAAGSIVVCALPLTWQVVPVSSDSLSEQAGRAVIPASGTLVDDDLIQKLRDAGQR